MTTEIELKPCPWCKAHVCPEQNLRAENTDLKAQNAALQEAHDHAQTGLKSARKQEGEMREKIAALTAERDTFYMDYRLKCDAETKALTAELERLRDLIVTLNPPEQCPASCTCGYGCPHGDGCLALCDCPEWEPPNGPYDEARAILDARAAREAGKA